MSETGPHFPPSREKTVTAALAAIIIARIIVSASVNPAAGYLQNAAAAALLVLIIIGGPITTIPRTIALGLILYAGAIIVGIPASLNPPDSLRQALLHIGDIIIFLAVIQVRPKPKTIAAAAAIGATISAAYALRQHFGGFARTLASPLADEYARETLAAGRVFGLTFSPDMLAAVISATMPISLHQVRSALASRKRTDEKLSLAIHLSSIPIMALALYYTRSLGGFLATTTGIAVWAIIAFQLNPARIGKKKFAAAAAVIAAATIAAAIGVIHERGGHFLAGHEQDNPVLERLDNWKTGLRVAREFTLTGAGAGQYGLAMKLHRSLRGNEARHVHNTPIEVLAETGPAGLAGWTLIMAAFVTAGIRSRNPEVAGFFAGGAALALHSLIDFDWTTPEVAVVFWVAAAMVLRAPPQNPGVRLGRTIKAALAAALAVTIAAELYQAEAARRFDAAQAAARAGEWAEAKSLARIALAWDKQNDRTWDLLARSMAATEPLSDRSFAIQKAIAINPRYPYYYRDLGETLRRRDPAAAGRAFARAVQLYPNSIDLNLVLGRWLLDSGHNREAEKVLLHAAKCHWSNAGPLLELARLYVLEGRIGDARAKLLAAAPSVHLTAGQARAVAAWLQSQNQPGLARDLLDAWQKSHPGKNAP